MKSKLKQEKQFAYPWLITLICHRKHTVNKKKAISLMKEYPAACYLRICILVAIITSLAGMSIERDSRVLSMAGFIPPSSSGSQMFSETPEHPVESNLEAAVVKVDITPPVGIPLAGYAGRDGGSTGIRDPLQAAVLLLDDGSIRAVIVSMDMIGVGYEETQSIREAIVQQTDIPAEHILVAASHTHGSPRLKAGSNYGRMVIEKIAGASAWASTKFRPVTFSYGEEEISFSVNRRLVNPGGIAEMKPNPGGIDDPRVKVLRFEDDAMQPVAVLMHVTCHPNVFRAENTQITADFPGEAQQFVERVYGNSVPSLFLQGAAGNTRPDLPSPGGFRSGDESDMKRIGMELGAAVVKASEEAGNRDLARDKSYKIKAAVRTIELPGKTGDQVLTDLQALRVGRVLFLTLPGEPFVQYGFHLEQYINGIDSPVGHVFLVGYANGAIGYICTEESYQFEGYEPGVSPLAPEAESILQDEMLKLAKEVL